MHRFPYREKFTIRIYLRRVSKAPLVDQSGAGAPHSKDVRVGPRCYL